jgi:adenosylhomocysteine nucleosidase
MYACPINLVAALPAEAKPIAARFGLERVQPDIAFPVYRGRHLTLVVTGPGKVNAAAATAFLGSLGGCSKEAIWVNFGIAGHAERRVGEVLLASRIRDSGSGQVWNPSLPAVPPFPADCLLTLDRPDLGYEHEGMVDMEASGFFPTACRYSSFDLVQVLKVISDNRNNTAEGLGAKQVRSLMAGLLEPVELLVSSLQARAQPRGEVIGMRRAG